MGSEKTLIKCTMCGVEKYYTKENFPKDATQTSHLADICRPCKLNQGKTYKNSFGQTIVYKERECLSCGRRFNSSGIQNRRCKMCKYGRDRD